MSDAPRPAPKYLIPALSAANFVVGMGAFLIVGTIEPVADAFQATDAQAGALLTTYSLVYAVASPIIVSATGAIGRRRVLAAGMAVFALASLLSALAPSLFGLHLARALAAAGAGVITPIAATVAAMLVPPERRARSLAAVFLGLTISQAIGIPVGGWIAYSIGWRPAFGLVFLLAVPAVIVIWRMVPPGLSFAPVALSDLGKTLRDGPKMAAVLFTATFLGAIFILYTYFAPLLAEDMGYGRDGVTLMLFIFGLGAIGGNILGGALSDRFGPSRTLLALTLLQILTLPLYSFLPIPSVILFAFTFVWSVIGWSFGAPQQARLITLDPARAPVLLSLNAASIYVGAAIGAWIGGWAIEASGVATLGIVATVGMVAALIHLIWSDRATAAQLRHSP